MISSSEQTSVLKAPHILKQVHFSIPFMKNEINTANNFFINNKNNVFKMSPFRKTQNFWYTLPLIPLAALRHSGADLPLLSWHTRSKQIKLRLIKSRFLITDFLCVWWFFVYSLLYCINVPLLWDSSVRFHIWYHFIVHGFKGSSIFLKVCKTETLIFRAISTNLCIWSETFQILERSPHSTHITCMAFYLFHTIFYHETLNGITPVQNNPHSHFIFYVDPSEQSFDINIYQPASFAFIVSKNQ